MKTILKEKRMMIASGEQRIFTFQTNFHKTNRTLLMVKRKT